MKLHAIIGGGVLGLLLALAGFPINTWQYWVILIYVVVFYSTKPVRITT